MCGLLASVAGKGSCVGRGGGFWRRGQVQGVLCTLSGICDVAAWGNWLAASVVDSLAQSFLVIDRSSSISQVHAFNVTDSCYRMTRKLNESNAG